MTDLGNNCGAPNYATHLDEVGTLSYFTPSAHIEHTSRMEVEISIDLVRLLLK